VTAASLSISRLSVSFGGVRALADVSLDVDPGTICGLIGPNGSGKTTLLDAISGVVTPSAGSIAVDGNDLAELHPDERIELGAVRSFQDCRLYPALTVTDTLLLIGDARRPVGVVSSTLRLPWARRLERTARQAVDEVIDAFGLDRFRDHRIGHLSTGTRRVVDLASIVLADPRLLLLDEPTAGIAQREAEAFIPLLRQLHDVTGATIVLVEHDVPLVFDLCETVVVMATGQVVSAGAPTAVKADPAAVAAYLGASEEALHVTGDTVRPGADGS
jgi:ABC-type branched-subunit amino acid transport system ATPase component